MNACAKCSNSSGPGENIKHHFVTDNFDLQSLYKLDKAKVCKCIDFKKWRG